MNNIGTMGQQRDPNAGMQTSEPSPLVDTRTELERAQDAQFKRAHDDFMRSLGQ